MRINTKDRINKQRKQSVNKRQVKQMILSNMEKVQLKYLNTVIYQNSISAVAGTLVNPTFPSQGVTNGEREGDSLAIDHIEARIVITNIADITTSSNASDAIRLVCCQARANTVLTVSSPSAPSTGIFDFGTSGAVDITSHINFNAQNELFHVLHDQTYSSNFLSSNAFRQITLKLKPRVSKVNFTPTTTTSLCGGIFWVAMSWQAGTTYISLEQRLIYHDL
jgi:hypothetical protein